MWNLRLNHPWLRFMAVRVALAAGAFCAGLVIYIPAHAQLWGGIYQAYIVGPGQEDYVGYVHAIGYDKSGNLIGEREQIEYAIPWSKRYFLQPATIIPGCTYQQVALGLWPLFITRWRLWPIVRGAFLAALIGFGLNFWRLYITHQLVFWWDAPWPVAHSLPSWLAGTTAFALGLWYMWRTARQLVEKQPAGDAHVAGSPRPIHWAPPGQCTR